MRVWSPSLKGMPLAGRVVYLIFSLLILGVVLYGLSSGVLFVSAMAAVLAVPFALGAPFVLGGRWRRPPPRPTRRPVVRRRRH